MSFLIFWAFFCKLNRLLYYSIQSIKEEHSLYHEHEHNYRKDAKNKKPKKLLYMRRATRYQVARQHIYAVYVAYLILITIINFYRTHSST